MTTFLSDAVQQVERALLGSILLDNSVWPETETLTVDDFSLDSHRRIYSHMAAMFQDQRPVDLVTLGTEFSDLDRCGGPGYLSELVDGCVPRNVSAYVRQISEAALERRYQHLSEHLGNATDKEERLATLERMQELLKGNSTAEDTKSACELIVIRGDEVSEKPLCWMWKYYLPLGKLVHCGGNSSQAKSPVTVDLAARVSTGTAWPDGTPNTDGPRSIIMLNIEDGLEDTILPRFRLAGGDKSKLYYVKGTRMTVSKTDFMERLMTLDRDMQHLVELGRGLPDLGMIVIDPITNYLGSKKYIDEGEMRTLLTPLANLAAELTIVVITVGHLNRREKGTDPLHRMMGAAAFSGVARAVYSFGPDPENESKFAHVMTAVRGCGGEGPALRYHTELVTENCPDCEPNEIIKVVWDGQSTATAEDSVDPTPLKEKAQEEKAAELLRDLLQEGKRPAKECQELLKSEGYDLDKLNARRVRRKAGADSKKFAGDRFNSWYLPSASLTSA